MVALTIVTSAIMAIVVLVDVALPNHFHGPRQYREDWIACRNFMCDIQKFFGVDIIYRASRAGRVMALFFDKPTYRNEWGQSRLTPMQEYWG